jgi:C4-dicarboxylate transporter DctM subunit
MPAIIIGGILGGIFTPTEAAAVAVFYALLLGGPVYRKLDLRTLGMNVLTAGIQSSLIFLIIATAISFKWVLAVLNVPAAILGFLESFYQNPWVAITLVNIFFLIVGLFFELGAAVILFGPIFAPAMVKMGFDPLHFGIIMIVNLVIGLCTPPVGVCLYATCSVCDASLEDLCREVWPIILLYIGVLAFITYFPYLTLWLPRALGF